MKPNKKKSDVWKYFLSTSSTTAQCKLCLKLLKTSGNTTNLMVHLKKIHGNTQIMKNKYILTVNADAEKIDVPVFCSTGHEEDEDDVISNSTCSTSRAIQAQATISDTFKTISAFSKGGQKHAQITDAILFMICKDYLPLSTVEHCGFQQLMKVIAPLYKIPSRRHFGRLLQSKYEVISENFKTILSNCNYVSLTTDAWTETHKTEGFMGVTVHWLDHTIMKSVTLDICKLNESHTADYLQNTLQEILVNWQIPLEKVLSITTDNGNNIVKACSDLLGKSRHIRCFAHTLNLVPENSFKKSPLIEQTLDKVRRTVRWFKSSVKATDQLRKAQINDGVEQNNILKVIQDVSTRWNSTFFMVDRYIQIKKYIDEVSLNNTTAPMVLSGAEYEVLKELWQFLKPLEAATQILSGEQYITISKVIPIINCLQQKLDNIIPANNHVSTFKETLMGEFRKRFSQVEQVSHFAVATLLDPRYKKIHFNDVLAVSRGVEFIRSSMGSTSPEIVNVVSTAESETSGCSIGQSENQNSYNLWDHHLQLVAQTQSVRRIGNDEEITLIRNAELSQYLNAPLSDLNVDPFVYWENHKSFYPNLYPVARKRLQLTATSVPSERLFSKAGLIMGERRSKLTADKLKQILFLNSYSYSDWC